MEIFCCSSKEWGLLEKLIIAAHADDEALGCVSVLKNSIVFICSYDSSREEELLSASKDIEYSFYQFNEEENNFNLHSLIKEFELAINTWQPNMVFIPHPGYHQDHTVAYNASIAALRPHETNFFVKKVFIYESIHDFLWTDKVFTPNYFIPIDIEEKIKAFSFYKSQMKSHRSIESITQLAALRGKQANVPYAEAFKVIRWIL
jgi:LmbE family N-acetylglucosaminyl deacetylase